MATTLHFITLSRTPAKVDNLRSNLIEIFGFETPSDNLGPHAPNALFRLHVADGTQYDLFTGYNQAAEKVAQLEPNPHLVFLHDDVELLGIRRLWDPALKLLSKPFTGVLGLAGATVMPETGCWWQQPHEQLRGMVAHPTTNCPPFGFHWNCWPFGAAHFGRVVITDGLLMAMRYNTWKKLGGFASEYYQGFHFYDLDFTLRAHLSGLQNYVFPYPVLHNSHGVPNEEYDRNRKLFLERFQGQLPARL